MKLIKFVGALALVVLLGGLLIFLCGRIGYVGSAAGLVDDFPPPTGPYVNDPTSGRSFNFDEYEKLTGRSIAEFHEAPMLAERCRAGKLPPVAERLPDNPLVLVPWERIGRYGGRLRYTEFTIGYDHYLRHLNEVALLEQRPTPGAAPCFKWMEGEPQPGVLEHWAVNADATQFTLRIRRGLKWSDGEPVTTEDVRFCFEDVLMHEKVTSPLPLWARWGGKPLKLEVLDDHTFRLTFAQSYGLFLRELATMRWGQMILPKHFLRRYHIRYTSPAKLAPLMQRYSYNSEDANDWGRFYLKMGGGIQNGSGGFVPERMPPGETIPTLDPWVHVRQPNPGDYILERNPFFYKVDAKGNQLPYIDELARTFVSNIQIQNLKILSGETDLQFQFIRLDDFPLFKRGEKRGNYRVVLLPAWQDYMLIYPLNPKPKDPVMQPVLSDVRFRRALSLALNRAEIREAMFLGMGRVAQLAPLPGSPWYKKEFTEAWADYDPNGAVELLNEMGLGWDAEHKFRTTREGKPLTLRIDYYDVSPTSGPGAELAKAYWEEIGIHVRVQQMDGSRFWQLRGANEIQATVWWANGASPAGHCFISGFLMNQPWGLWQDTDGESGEEPPDWAKAVMAARERVYSDPDPNARDEAGRDVFQLFSDNLWTIGAVADVPVPFVYSRKLANLDVAGQRKLYAICVAEAAEQWFFKE